MFSMGKDGLGNDPFELTPQWESLLMAWDWIRDHGEIYRGQMAKKVAMRLVLQDWLLVRGRFYIRERDADYKEFGMWFDTETKRLLRIAGSQFEAEIMAHTKIDVGDNWWRRCLDNIESMSASRDTSEFFDPERYFCRRDKAVYISNGDGRMAKITANGVDIVDNGTDGVIFAADACLRPWRLTDRPQDPFAECDLWRNMATSDTGRLTFRLWATLLPFVARTKPPLCVTGPIGSGKTRAIRGLFELYGMEDAIFSVTEKGEDDFWVGIDQGGLFCLDNADVNVKWLRNTLETAATGAGVSKRKLYTNDEQVHLRPNAWLAISSADPEGFAGAPGLSDRLVIVHLDRRIADTADSELSRQIIDARDDYMSWIAYAAGNVLLDEQQGLPITEALNRRYPDWGALAERLGRQLGLQEETRKALAAAEQDKSLFTLQNNRACAALLTICGRSTSPIKGTVADLKEQLEDADERLEKTSAVSIGKYFNSCWPALEKVLRAERHKRRDGVWEYEFQPYGLCSAYASGDGGGAAPVQTSLDLDHVEPDGIGVEEYERSHQQG